MTALKLVFAVNIGDALLAFCVSFCVQQNLASKLQALVSERNGPEHPGTRCKAAENRRQEAPPSVRLRTRRLCDHNALALPEFNMRIVIFGRA